MPLDIVYVVELELNLTDCEICTASYSKPLVNIKNVETIEENRDGNSITKVRKTSLYAARKFCDKPLLYLIKHTHYFLEKKRIFLSLKTHLFANINIDIRLNSKIILNYDHKAY